jgi:thiol-disulfide isomerase/thioredoxin
MGGAAVLAFIGVVVLGPFSGGGTARAILDAARLRFDQVQPFDARVASTIDRATLVAERPDYTGGDHDLLRRVRYEGHDRWRRDTLAESDPPLLDGGPGSFWVWDGSELGIYRADDDAYFVQPTVPSYDPLGELSWENVADRGCEEAGRIVGEEVVAGVRTQRIECPDGEVWVDPQSGLIMRHTADGFSSEIVALTFDPTSDPGSFIVEPPPGAGPGPSEPPATNLVVGAATPGWGELPLDDDAFSLDDIQGARTAIFVTADWCEPCLDQLPDVADLGDDPVAGLSIVSVAVLSSRDRIAEELDARGLTLPVVIDEDGLLDQAWEIEAFPLLVVIGPDGVVEDVAVGPEIAPLLERLRQSA